MIERLSQDPQKRDKCIHLFNDITPPVSDIDARKANALRVGTNAQEVTFALEDWIEADSKGIGFFNFLGLHGWSAYTFYFDEDDDYVVGFSRIIEIADQESPSFELVLRHKGSKPMLTKENFDPETDFYLIMKNSADEEDGTYLMLGSQEAGKILVEKIFGDQNAVSFKELL